MAEIIEAHASMDMRPVVEAFVALILRDGGAVAIPQSFLAIASSLLDESERRHVGAVNMAQFGDDTSGRGVLWHVNQSMYYREEGGPNVES